MRGSITLNYVGQLPDEFIEALQELKGPFVRKVKPLVLEDDSDIDGLLNLVLGMLRTSLVHVRNIELRRDRPDSDAVTETILVAAS